MALTAALAEHTRVLLQAPPGAGKSTLVDGMVTRLRQTAARVAVISVDPSSLVTGGAVLGDRIRMSRHAEDAGVFIRSMAARGALGGLAPATGDAVTILDAMRFDIIIIDISTSTLRANPTRIFKTTPEPSPTATTFE